MQIDPCNTTVNASINFGGTTFDISPNTFNLGPTYNKSDRCTGGFVAAPVFPASSEQSFLLDGPTDKSHKQQNSGSSVMSSCKMCTQSSMSEDYKSVLPHLHRCCELRSDLCCT
jgi:hypothetical protein